MKELFGGVATALRPLLHHEFSQLYLYDPEIRQLRTRALYFPNGKGLAHEGLISRIENTPAGWVYTHRCPLRMDRPDPVRTPNDVVDRLLAEGVRSGCCVPVIHGHRVFGVLSVGSSHEAAFGEDHGGLLCLAARQLAMAMEGRLTHDGLHCVEFDLAEAIWVAGAKAGFGPCFDELVRRNETSIFRLAMSITRNEGDAEDAMQETFVKAFQHLGEFRGDSRFATWLASIAVNEALLKLRKRLPKQTAILEFPEKGNGRMPFQIEDCGPTPEQHYSQTELQRVISGAIGRLPPTYRMVLILRDIKGFSTKEAAQLLGLSLPAVKSRLLRARLKLRASLHRHFRARTTKSNLRLPSP